MRRNPEQASREPRCAPGRRGGGGSFFFLWENLAQGHMRHCNAARRTGSEVGAVWRHGGERYVPYSGLTRVIRITSELLRLGSNAGITVTS